MIIQESSLVLYSDNQEETRQLSLDHREATHRTGDEAGPVRPAWAGPPTESVLLDRVSIRQTAETRYQSNYAAQVSAQSRVTGTGGEGEQRFDRRTAVEKMVGGIIDRQVVVSQMDSRQDVLVDGMTIGPGPAAGIAPRQTPDRPAAGSRLILGHTDIHFQAQSARFQSRGQVSTRDGRSIDFSLGFSVDRSLLSRTEERLMIDRWQERVALTDPLVISLDGRVPVLTDTTFAFDLDSDGQAEQVGFTKAGSGFLAFDRNMDGRINNGTELFGPGTGNGFEELAAHDRDANGWIDEADAVFSKLSVWVRDDTGQDQLISLKDAGLGAISLDYAATTLDMTGADNTLDGRMQRSGIFLFENGAVGSVHQVDLAARKETPDAETVPPPPLPGMPIAPGTGFDSQAMAPATPTGPGQETADTLPLPLKELLEQLDKIKEELARFYESRDRDKRGRGTGRGRGKRHRAGYAASALDPALFSALRTPGIRFGPTSGRYA